MRKRTNSRGFTVVELVALMLIGALVLGIAVPKFIMASHMRKTRKLTLVLNRLWDAQYEYHKQHGRFAGSVRDLDIRKSDLKSRWFMFSVPYASRDTFFVQASVKRSFGRTTVNDWAGISSAKVRSISDPETLGKYAVEWMDLMKRDRRRRERERKRQEKQGEAG
ncbi:MAG: hypothetical protein GF418_03360 [Chitinivibrionales bacterium]|nr:hypothetical protein [Chitinivibrionales bacterium]MBD3394641.1 hypothetical protein [Chitinivibrionales bacterium]